MVNLVTISKIVSFFLSHRLVGHRDFRSWIFYNGCKLTGFIQSIGEVLPSLHVRVLRDFFFGLPRSFIVVSSGVVVYIYRSERVMSRYLKGGVGSRVGRDEVVILSSGRTDLREKEETRIIESWVKILNRGERE